MKRGRGREGEGTVAEAVAVAGIPQRSEKRPF